MSDDIAKIEVFKMHRKLWHHASTGFIPNVDIAAEWQRLKYQSQFYNTPVKMVIDRSQVEYEYHPVEPG